MKSKTSNSYLLYSANKKARLLSSSPEPIRKQLHEYALHVCTVVKYVTVWLHTKKITKKQVKQKHKMKQKLLTLSCDKSHRVLQSIGSALTASV